MEFPDGYIEIDINDIAIFIGAISQFKDAVITILIKEDDSQVAIIPDIDQGCYKGFLKQSFVIIPSQGLIPWNTPKGVHDSQDSQ